MSLLQVLFRFREADPYKEYVPRKVYEIVSGGKEAPTAPLNIKWIYMIHRSLKLILLLILLALDLHTRNFRMITIVWNFYFVLYTWTIVLYIRTRIAVPWDTFWNSGQVWFCNFKTRTKEITMLKIYVDRIIYLSWGLECCLRLSTHLHSSLRIEEFWINW